MAMRETPGSIRAYFILVGVVSGLCNFFLFSAAMGDGVMAFFGLTRSRASRPPGPRPRR